MTKINNSKVFSFQTRLFCIMTALVAVTAIVPAYSNDSYIVYSIIFASLFVAWRLGSSIVNDISKLIDVLLKIAENETDVSVPLTNKKSEIGNLALSIQALQENVSEKKASEDITITKARRTERKLRSEILSIAGAMQVEIQKAINNLSEQSNSVKISSDKMSNMIQQARTQSDTTTAATDNASTHVDSVSVGADEMAVSIEKIRAQVADSTKNTTGIVEKISVASDHMNKLLSIATAIDEIVGLINDIASQTNLLALNATIEAARAGDAGKGFAVVASEVKTLANKTADATEEITNQINEIQNATTNAAAVIKEISGTIGYITEFVADISLGVEEQSAGIVEISRNAQQAASHTKEALDNVSKVSSNIGEAGSSYEEMHSATKEAHSQVMNLREGLMRIISSFAEENRHENKRHTVNFASTVTIDGQSNDCLLQEISLCGAATLDRVFEHGNIGAQIIVSSSKLGELEGAIIATTDRLTFVWLDIDKKKSAEIEHVFN